MPAANGGTGLTAYGTANQIMGMNATGTALEYKTVSGTTNQITVTNAANSLTLSLPQNIHTAATPTFGGLTLSNLTPGSIAPKVSLCFFAVSSLDFAYCSLAFASCSYCQ